MTDDQLSLYIPVLGDRIMIRQFLSSTGLPSSSSTSRLLAAIRSKRLQRSDNSSTEPTKFSRSDSTAPWSSLVGNRNAAKQKRRIELGWLNDDKGCLKQVRTRTGGGTRHLTVSQDANKADLLQLGREMFFPGGTSTKGLLSSFTEDIVDCQEQPLSGEVTVGQLYQKLHLPMLRFYFVTKSKCFTPPGPDNDSDDYCDVVDLDHTKIPGRPMHTHVISMQYQSDNFYW